MMITMTIQRPSDGVAAQVAQARGAAQAAQQEARNAAEQARDIARANREAAQAQRDAAQARRDAAQAAGAGGAPGTVITITKDGKTVTIDNASPEAAATALGIPLPSRNQDIDPGPYIVGGIAIMSVAIVLIVAQTFRFRLKMRSAAPSALPNDVAQRLARMEAGIESVAVEVERISEGQRFTTRLLSERAPVEVPRG